MRRTIGWVLGLLALVPTLGWAQGTNTPLFPSYTWTNPTGVVVKNDFNQLAAEVVAVEGRAPGRSAFSSRPAASTLLSSRLWIVTDCATTACTAGAGTIKCLARVNDAGSAWDVGPCDGTGGGSTAFSALISGTNTGAAMIVGTGASLDVSGTGTIKSTNVVCSACIDLASEISGTLPLANLTDNNTTAGLCLLSGGSGADPNYATCPGGGGSGTITSSTAQQVPVYTGPTTIAGSTQLQVHNTGFDKSVTFPFLLSGYYGPKTVHGPYGQMQLAGGTLTLLTGGAGSCVGDTTPSTCEYSPGDFTHGFTPMTDTGGTAGGSRGGYCGNESFMTWCWCDSQCVGGWVGWGSPAATNCPDTDPYCGTKLLGDDTNLFDGGGVVDGVNIYKNSGNTTGQRIIGASAGWGMFTQFIAQDTNTSATNAGLDFKVNPQALAMRNELDFLVVGGNATLYAPQTLGDREIAAVQRGASVDDFAAFEADAYGKYGPCTCSVNADCNSAPIGTVNGLAGICTVGYCSQGLVSCTQDSQCGSGQTCATGDLTAFTGLRIPDTTSGVATNAMCTSSKHPFNCCTGSATGTCDSTVHTRYGVRSQLATEAGTDKRNLYLDGSAPSNIVGNLRIGDTTAATSALEVTDVASATRAMKVDLTGSLTANNPGVLSILPGGLAAGAGWIVNMLDASPTVTASANGTTGFGSLTWANLSGTVQNDSGNARTLNNPTSININPSFNANNAALTLSDLVSGAYTGILINPGFTRTGTPSSTAATVNDLNLGGGIGTAGWTITTWNPLKIGNPALNGSTITNLIGIDIANLTSGGTNIDYRSAGGTMRHAGNVRIGDTTTAPTSPLEVLAPDGTTPAVAVTYGGTVPPAGSTVTRSMVQFSDTISDAPTGANNHKFNGVLFGPTVTHTASGSFGGDWFTSVLSSGTYTDSASNTAAGIALRGLWMQDVVTSTTNNLGNVTGADINPTLISTSAGNPPTLINSFVARPIIKYNVASGSATRATVSNFADQTALDNATAGGTFNVTDENSFYATPDVRQTAGTMHVATLHQFHATNAQRTVGTATIDTQVGFDCDNMTVATTNICLRQQGTGATNRLAGSTILGSTANAPGALLHIQQQTAGTEVMRTESVATTSNPVCSVYQQRLTCTGGTTATFNVATATGLGYSIDATALERCTGGTSCATAQAEEFHTRAAIANNAGTLTTIGQETTTLAGGVTGAAAANLALSGSGTNIVTTVTCQANVNATWALKLEVCTIGG